MSDESLEDKVKRMLDEYGNFTHAKELLKSEKQSAINKTIPIEVQQELEYIEEEFADKEKMIEEKEKKYRQHLDNVIAQYIKTLNVGKDSVKIKTELMTLTVFPNKIEWNTKELDKLILSGNTNLLPFRNQLPPKTRITKNNL